MIKLTYKRKNRIKITEEQDSPSAKPETETLIETVLSASQVSLSAVASAPSCDGEPPPHQVIKLGIDVHLDRYVVVRQIDGLIRIWFLGAAQVLSAARVNEIATAEPIVLVMESSGNYVAEHLRLPKTSFPEIASGHPRNSLRARVHT